MGKRNTKQIGKSGEDQAVNFLKRNHYNILERNYKNKLGEIDIIAEDGPVLCFIEVKTRTTTSFGSPEEAINRTKQRKISQIVLAYLKAHKRIEGSFRFDVVAIVSNEPGKEPEINLLKDAFELDPQYFF